MLHVVKHAPRVYQLRANESSHDCVEQAVCMHHPASWLRLRRMARVDQLLKAQRQ